MELELCDLSLLYSGQLVIDLTWINGTSLLGYSEQQQRDLDYILDLL